MTSRARNPVVHTLHPRPLSKTVHEKKKKRSVPETRRRSSSTRSDLYPVRPPPTVLPPPRPQKKTENPVGEEEEEEEDHEHPREDEAGGGAAKHTMIKPSKLREVAKMVASTTASMILSSSLSRMQKALEKRWFKPGSLESIGGAAAGIVFGIVLTLLMLWIFE